MRRTIGGTHNATGTGDRAAAALVRRSRLLAQAQPSTPDKVPCLMHLQCIYRVFGDFILLFFWGERRFKSVTPFTSWPVLVMVGVGVGVGARCSVLQRSLGFSLGGRTGVKRMEG
ncbi:hypothetical protein QBC42DRAFT_272455 [Cladorrhinum samala]|uniref:Uncharacterized protein n=1 Tax=Cladorrhinum samala TaxID=585594 RepID=A0AAV9HK89_9PEZI|nr:hypothetical protein QBC42DRAFT_272455 [Cladorrhinum samala]